MEENVCKLQYYLFKIRSKLINKDENHNVQCKTLNKKMKTRKIIKYPYSNEAKFCILFTKIMRMDTVIVYMEKERRTLLFFQNNV